MNIWIISLIGTIVFGIIDAVIFLFSETTLQKKFNQISFFDENMSELLTSGISSSIALFFATMIRLKLKKIYKILEHPLIDVIGIMMGTILIMILYYTYKVYHKKNKISNHNLRKENYISL